MSGQPRHLPGGHGIELAQQQQHVREMLEGVERIGVLLVRASGERRFYRVIVTAPKNRGMLYTPTGAIAAALGYRIVDGTAGAIEIVLDGGNFDGHHEIAADLAKLCGRTFELDRM